MKNLIVLTITLFSFSAFATGGLTSSGKDINCTITFSSYSKFSTCETPYGTSDKCHDLHAEAVMTLTSVTGDLDSGISGDMIPARMFFTQRSGNNDFDTQLISIINSNNFSAQASYAYKFLTLNLISDSGIITKTEPKDFSAGVRGSYGSLSTELPMSATMPQNLSVFMYCSPTTK